MWGLIRNSIVKDLERARTAMAALGDCRLDATPDASAVVGRVKAGKTVTVWGVARTVWMCDCM